PLHAGGRNHGPVPRRQALTPSRPFHPRTPAHSNRTRPRTPHARRSHPTTRAPPSAGPATGATGRRSASTHHPRARCCGVGDDEHMTQVCELSAALRQQWAMLQERINELTSATLEQPSTLEGWTVRELIAHLTCSLGLIGRCEVLGPPALDAGVSPQALSLGDYLGSYSPDSASIAAHGRREAQRLGSDIAEAVHAEMDQALAHLPQI